MSMFASEFNVSTDGSEERIFSQHFSRLHLKLQKLNRNKKSTKVADLLWQIINIPLQRTIQPSLSTNERLLKDENKELRKERINLKHKLEATENANKNTLIEADALKDIFV